MRPSLSHDSPPPVRHVDLAPRKLLVYLDFIALVGNLGEAGSHVRKLREMSVEYLLNVGSAD